MPFDPKTGIADDPYMKFAVAPALASHCLEALLLRPSETHVTKRPSEAMSALVQPAGVRPQTITITLPNDHRRNGAQNVHLECRLHAGQSAATKARAPETQRMKHPYTCTCITCANRPHAADAEDEV